MSLLNGTEVFPSGQSELLWEGIGVPWPGNAILLGVQGLASNAELAGTAP